MNEMNENDDINSNNDTKNDEKIEINKSIISESQ